MVRANKGIDAWEAGTGRLPNAYDACPLGAQKTPRALSVKHYI